MLSRRAQVLVAYASAAILPLCAGSETASARAPIYKIAPPAAWVEPVRAEYEAPPPPDGVREGSYYLLYDTQIDVRPDGHEQYSHIAIRALTSAAVGRNAQIDVAVNPSYQTLALHFVRLVRAGDTIDQLGRARITELPQETELQNGIYHGAYNINLLLEDLRVGDVVEFAYTRRSEKLLPAAHFATELDFGWSDPVRWQRLRVRHPVERSVRFRAHGADVTPTVSSRGGHRELLFEWRDLAATSADPRQPAWYSPWPRLEFTDRENWAQAARDVTALYSPPRRIDGRVGTVVESIKTKGGTIEEQAHGALQFVQDEIRYTSIPIGPGSLRPAAPETVLERRFGDCKDKSLLLVTLLRGLGIQATPALVHTTRGHLLPEALPSPFAFDHVIVRATLPSGVYWLDATLAKQSAPLTSLEPPDYEYALPLDPATRELEPIPRPATDVTRQQVHAEFDARGGLLRPATLAVTTRYFGAMADAMRAQLSRTHATQREKDFLNYYARLYPGVQSAGPIEVDDDTGKNVLEVRERYRLDGAFTRGEDGVLTLALQADELSRFASELDGPVRTSPLALEFPAHVTQTITVRLPEDWVVKDEVVTVDNPAFRYRSEVRYALRTLNLRYEYVALADHVPLAALPRYVADRKRMDRDLGVTLARDPEADSLADMAIAPLPLVVLLGAFGIGIWLACRPIYHYDPAPPPAPVAGEGPRGIRGWLLMPALGAIAMPIILLVLLGGIAVYVRADIWRTIPELASSEARQWIRPSLLLLCAATAIAVPASVAVGVLFFTERTAAPRMFVALLWYSNILGLLIETVLALSGLDPETAPVWRTSESAPEVLGLILWTVYMRTSKRVRATFIRRRTVRWVPEVPMVPDSVGPGASAGEGNPTGSA